MEAYRLYSSLPRQTKHETVAEISLGALHRNYDLLLQAIRRTTPDVRPVCVVKADAYGHGAEVVSRALMEAGCDFFAVACLDEATALRSLLGPGPDILILGYTDPDCAAELAANNIIQAVISEEYMRRLACAAEAAGVVLRVHLKLDTGMNRLGLPAQTDKAIARAAEVAAELAASPHLRLEGMFTHFARADEGTCRENPPAGMSGEEYTANQFRRFMAVDSLLRERGINIPHRHVCNSAAALRYPEYRLEMVRLGIMLYGLLPSDEVSFPGLLPVMRLRSVVSHVYDLPPGATVGYGGCFVSDMPRKIAVIPVGYADGFLRAYTGGTIKIYHDNIAYPATVVGRVCMDQLTADITGTPCTTGDTAVLFGEEPGDLEELAHRAGTIGYESLCLISSRVPRYYV
ncbi:MAG: alanine racemase [Clostridiales bacterium]|nr:alanine racemase [Clostridiales bacterium]